MSMDLARKTFSCEPEYFIAGTNIRIATAVKEAGADLSAHTPVLLAEGKVTPVAEAAKLTGKEVVLDAYCGIGTIGLIKAVDTYDCTRTTRFASYASRCIENEILMHIRKIANQKTEVSLDEPINTDWDGNELLLSDVLGTDGDIVMRPLEDDVDHQLLRQALGRLPEREKQIVSMRFGLGGRQEKTQKEVADIMGISQSYISRLEKRIMLRLRREISRQIYS